MLKISKSIQVAASRSDAFTLFTRDMRTWWPPGPQPWPAPVACLEPFVGGRWYEQAVDRSEHLWGHVLAWAPLHGVTLSWKIGADGEFDEELHTEVEVLFKTLSTHTATVSLEHRHLEGYRDRAMAQRHELGSSTGWSGVLEHFARHCAAVNAARQETAGAMRER
jgi:hypothetical protein